MNVSKESKQKLEVDGTTNQSCNGMWMWQRAMRQVHGGIRVHLIACGSRKMDEVIRLRPMEDLMENERWIKYLINRLGGWYEKLGR